MIRTVLAALLLLLLPLPLHVRCTHQSRPKPNGTLATFLNKLFHTKPRSFLHELKVSARASRQRMELDAYHVLDHLLRNESLSLSSSRCYVDLTTVRIALGLKVPWAVQMVDATFTLSGGFLEKEFDFLGVDDQCLETKVPPLVGFQPQYAIITFLVASAQIPRVMKPSAVTGLSMGFCVPDSCERRSLNVMISQILKFKNLTGIMSVEDVFFRSSNDFSLGGVAAGVVAFLSLWLLLLLLGTTCDVLYSRPTTSTSTTRRPRSQPQPAPPRVSVTPAPPADGDNVPLMTDNNVDEGVHEITDTDGELLEAESTPAGNGRPGKRYRIRIQSKPAKGNLQGQSGGTLTQTRESFLRVQVRSLIKLARCFSLYTNVPKLLDTSSTGTEISCLHGIRVISCMWVIFINAIFYKSLYMRNALSLMERLKHHTMAYSVFAKGMLGLDSLFTLSGLLIGYSGAMRINSRQGNNNWLGFILHRYGRTAPTLILVGIMYLALFPHITGGPLWTEQAPGYEDCKEWGWMNIFLIHNMAPRICLPWTWFFAVDFQLFLLAPLILVLNYRSPRVAQVVVGVILACCWIAGGVVTQYHHLPVSQYVIPDFFNTTGPNQTYSTPQSADDLGRMYFYPPYSHAGSFFPPLLLGFSLHTTNQRASFKTRTVIVGWLGALSGMSLAVFAASSELITNGDPNWVAVALYNALHRTVWSLGVCWVILVCCTGHSGPINSLLSWRPLKPVSRLVFVAYLVHPMIIMTHNACLYQLVYLTNQSGLYLSLGVIVLSFALSLLLTLTIEMPMTSLLHWITSCCRRPIC